MKVLCLRGVAKCYPARRGQASVDALKDLDLDIPAAQVTAVTGRKGAGKSTLVKVIAGLLRPDRGLLEIDGRAVVDRLQHAARVGAVFEGNRNVHRHLSVRENLEYLGVLRSLRLGEARFRAQVLIGGMGLSDCADQLAGSLPCGVQQRLALAVALLHRPELLVLDDPLLGVDADNASLLLRQIDSLREQGMAIVLAVHRSDVIDRIADRVAVLEHGALISIRRPDRARTHQRASSSVRASRSAFMYASGRESAPASAPESGPESAPAPASALAPASAPTSVSASASASVSASASASGPVSVPAPGSAFDSAPHSRLQTHLQIRPGPRPVRAPHCLLTIAGLDRQRLERLASMGVQQDGARLCFARERFYEVIDVVRPAAIQALSMGEAEGPGRFPSAQEAGE